MKITFLDKISTIISSLPLIHRITADDINEIKRVVNANAGTSIYDDSQGTNSSIIFDNELSNISDIEIIYCRRRASTGTSVFKSTGKLPYSNGMEIALDINYYSNDTNQQSIAKIVVVTDSGLTVNGENTMQNNGTQIVENATTNIYITKVIIY